MEKMPDLYSTYESEKYVHYRSVPSGEFKPVKVKSSKAGEVLKPVMKEIKVPFNEVRDLNLDKLSPAVPLADTEDFTIMSNYLVDFWGAIIGDSPISAYMHLKRYCYGKKDYCYPDLETIAFKMKKSINALKGYLDILEEHGFIVKFLRRDVTDNNRNVSPLFKIRRTVPIITKEMYDSLPDKLKELHDEYMKNLEGVQFANKIVSTKDAIEPIVDAGEDMNRKEREKQVEEIIRKGQLEEYVIQSLEHDKRVENSMFHDYIKEKISKPSYDTWIKNSIIITGYDSIKVLCSNEFVRDWVQERYSKMITEWAERELSLHFVEVDCQLITDYITGNLGRGA